MNDVNNIKGEEEKEGRKNGKRRKGKGDKQTGTGKYGGKCVCVHPTINEEPMKNMRTARRQHTQQ